MAPENRFSRAEERPSRFSLQMWQAQKGKSSIAFGAIMTAPTSLPLPSGQMGLLLLGETWSFHQNLDFAKKQHQQYEPLFKTSYLGIGYPF